VPGLPSTPAARWKFALKPASLPKLLVPMLLGQAIGIAASGSVSLPAIAFGLLFTVLDGVFIVLLNDWADREIDGLKRRLLPQAGSPKTIADGVLPALSLLVVGALAGAVALAFAIAAASWLDRPLLGWAALGCLLVFVAYSLPPLRLNYRGGGELLEALGVGVALPWLNAYAQSGRVVGLEVWVLSGYAVASLASAVASGLGDEVSDRAGGKRTVVTMLGNSLARRLSERLLLLAGVAWVVSALFVPEVTTKVAMSCATLAMFYGGYRLCRVSPGATTYAFLEQARYKLVLHRTIWGSGVTLAAIEIATFLALHA
jgi:1,4-dihydroxy-2-naphthoate octaprenyltransferase/chlorophyll synthase